MAKKFWKSKTLWIAGLQVVSGVALLLSDQLATGGALTVSGVIHAVLRVVTDSAVSWE